MFLFWLSSDGELRAPNLDTEARKVKAKGRGWFPIRPQDWQGSYEATDPITLRGRNGRFIDRVTLVYDTVGRGSKATVELWGKKTN
jgi:hypothetical protein